MALEQTVKQRLIGAIVLVAVAVIFLPGILGQKKEQKQFISEVPEKHFVEKTASSSTEERIVAKDEASNSKSQVQSHQEKPESATIDSSDETSSSDTPVVTETPTSAKEPPSNSGPANDKKAIAHEEKTESSKSARQSKPSSQVVTEKSKPLALKEDSWVVQVGSFSSHANAEILSKRLEEQKLKAFVRPVELDSEQILYRVFVGPWLQKDQAEKELKNIADITRLKPIVVAWNPEKQ